MWHYPRTFDGAWAAVGHILSNAWHLFRVLDSCWAIHFFELSQAIRCWAQSVCVFPHQPAANLPSAGSFQSARLGAVWLLPSMGAVHCVHFSRRHAGQPHNSAKVVECPYFAYPYGNSCIGASQHIYNYVHNIPENVANLFFHRLRASVASSGAAAGQR